MSLSEKTWKQQLDVYDEQIETHLNSVKIYAILLKKNLLDRADWIAGKSMLCGGHASALTLDQKTLDLANSLLKICNVPDFTTAPITPCRSAAERPCGTGLIANGNAERPCGTEDSQRITRNQLWGLGRDSGRHELYEIPTGKVAADESAALDKLMDEVIRRRPDNVAQQTITFEDINTVDELNPSAKTLNDGIAFQKDLISSLETVLDAADEKIETKVPHANLTSEIITPLHRMTRKEREYFLFDLFLEATKYIDANYEVSGEERDEMIQKRSDELLQDFIDGKKTLSKKITV
jgi:hypothetical protein